MRGAPARPVRACCVRSCCTVVVKEHDLHTAPAQCNAKQRLYSHCTLQSSHPALHTSHLHFTFHTSNSTLHLISSQLISSHLISSELFSPHLSSFHLISSLLIRQLSSACLFSFHRSTAQPFSPHAASLNSSRLFRTSESLRHRCIYTERSFTKILCSTKLAPSTSQYYFVLQSLHKARLNNNLHYKACTKYLPVLLGTTKLAQNTSQYYFALQSLHKALSSTTSYYKACTKHVLVIICFLKLAQSTSQYYFCTAKLAQSTSQYYFVLQSLHKVLASTTLYYKARPLYLTIEALTHSKLLHREALHTTNFCTKNCLHRESFLIHNDSRNCSSKTGSRRQLHKNTILKHFSKENLKGHHQRQNWENLLTNHYCSVDAAIPIRLTRITHAAVAI